MPKKKASSETVLLGLIATSTGEAPEDDMPRQKLGGASPARDILEKREHQHPMTEQRRIENKVANINSPA